MASVPKRIYLDHAATSWPKCASAVQAATEYIHQCGATTGRGSYRSATEATRWLHLARRALATLIGAAAEDSMAICHSGTHALNGALQGILRAGDHVITTSTEHNSVLRPLAALEHMGRIRVSYVPSDHCGRATPSDAEALVDDSTRLLVVGHASNVTGALADLAGWSSLAKRCRVPLLVDASQTLGYIPIDVREQGIDVLAAAGHKGLRALGGTGILYVAPELQAQLQPIMWGGTGVASEELDRGMDWPNSIEVGNLNMPGVVSLAVAAQQWIDASDSAISWQEPFASLIDGLQSLPALQMIGYPELWNLPHVPLVSLRATGWDVHDLAMVLGDEFGIEVRSGLHCAARIHASLQTTDGGTLRLSTGHSTTEAEIAYTLDAMRQLCG